jgi:ABC-type glycerol-3-phosphate transport system substrate-binding protein
LPPLAGSSVTIWHSWNRAETEVLRVIIRSFQRTNPDVTFTLLFVPLDDLYSTYRAAAYLGQGPSLLLGPARWGVELYKETLIDDLNPYVPRNYLADINAAALSSTKYQNSLLSLPLSLHGDLMFRNTSLITKPPSSFEELVSLSDRATHGGVVGSYLERGSAFSAANIIGLGGRLLGEDRLPLFNDEYGVQWLDLLAAYDVAGVVTLNTNLDLQMFNRGRVGIIVDGSWNIQNLAQSIGSDKLAIDPWPTFGSGQLSGWVEADSIFLNANTRENDRFAALSFMGYLLDPNVQMLLAEVGHIPVVMTTHPRDKLIQQAMAAFLTGVPYPTIADVDLLRIYWDELDQAIKDVFVSKIAAEIALKNANDTIIQTIKEARTTP